MQDYHRPYRVSQTRRCRHQGTGLQTRLKTGRGGARSSHSMCPNHEAAAINIGREEPTLSGRSAPKFRASRADRPLVRQVSTQVLPFANCIAKVRIGQKLPDSKGPSPAFSGSRPAVRIGLFISCSSPVSPSPTGSFGTTHSGTDFGKAPLRYATLALPAVPPKVPNREKCQDERNAASDATSVAQCPP